LDRAYVAALGRAFLPDAPAQVQALRLEFGPFGLVMEAHRQYLSGRIDRSQYKALLSNTLWNEGKWEKTQ
jgi:hypothetical protein